MDNDNKSRQNQLIAFLYELSSEFCEPSDIEKNANRLKLIYNDGEFRHSYSDFWPMIVEMKSNSNHYNIEILLQNLIDTKDYVENTPKYQCISKNIWKVVDHINLEMARMETFEMINNKAINTEEKLTLVSEKIKSAQKSVDKATKVAKGLQTEMISILGIFSAIIISFFGGISFISSAIASIHQSSVFKSAVIVLIAGIVLVNVLFILLYMVAQIIEKEVYVACQTEHCTCVDENGKPSRCDGITRIKKRLPYVYYINCFLVGLLILTSILWIIRKISLCYFAF